MSDFIVLTPEKNSVPVKKRFCYWTVADGKYAKMIENTIASARAVGVKEDFHVWTDQKIEGAITHECGNFDKHLYIFKFKFLMEHVKKLDYDYFIFLDADNLFVRNPGDILSVMGDSPVFACMENDCDPTKVKRREWWGCKIEFWNDLLRMNGVKTPKIYNTNAGFWIVKKDYVDTFYELGMRFWGECHRTYGLTQFTEEPALAFVAHIAAADYQDKHTLDKTSHIWASDWTGNFKNALPTGAPWEFEDYMSGEKKMVNPAIVHVMRSDDLMVAETEKRRARAYATTIDISKGFWMGHQMLGDVIGFCAAAHILHKKTGQIIKIHFPQEERRGITSYFTGIRWVKREEIPQAINCGMDPTPEQWPTMNGVKRFYRFMDPAMRPTISFDVHMNIEKYAAPKEKLIGIVAHSVTQGSIPTNVVVQMCKDALEKFPGYKLVLLGEKKNTFTFPSEFVIEDRRDEAADYDSLVEQIRNLSLLLCPQTGPCFIAAGLRVPMWVYRSKEVHWDYVLNYDTHKVEKWYDREKENSDLYINWKSGLGDAILHLSCCYFYGKHKKKKINLYSNNIHSNKKMKEIYDLYLEQNKDLTNYVNLVDIDEIQKDGQEVFEPKWKPIPSKNCEAGMFINNTNFISSFMEVMNFDTVDFPHGYLKYYRESSEKYVTFHIIGNSAGRYERDYGTTKKDIISMITKIINCGYKVKIIQPHDDFCRELNTRFRQHVELINEDGPVKNLFNIISMAAVHIGVDSGPAHVALSCGVPYFPFIPNKKTDLTFKQNDFTLGGNFDNVVEYLKHKKIPIIK